MRRTKEKEEMDIVTWQVRQGRSQGRTDMYCWLPMPRSPVVRPTAVANDHMCIKVTTNLVQMNNECGVLAISCLNMLNTNTKKRKRKGRDVPLPASAFGVANDVRWVEQTTSRGSIMRMVHQPLPPARATPESPAPRRTVENTPRLPEDRFQDSFVQDDLASFEVTAPHRQGGKVCNLTLPPAPANNDKFPVTS